MGEDVPVAGLQQRDSAVAEATAPLIGAIDLGKTSCRLRVIRGDDVADPLFEVSDSGAPGLAESRGAALAIEAVERALGHFTERWGLKLDSLVIGAAGTEASARGAQELASVIRRRASCAVVVCSDVLISHAGAFAGHPGTVLIAGTGAVALGLGGSGVFRQADGWGPWLGDEGSGRWIGQEGLRAALRSLDGRGPATALADIMRDIVGEPREVPGWVSRGNTPARTLATFALAVIDQARKNDVVAAGVVEQAIGHLTAAAAAASEAGGNVATVGGLTGNDYFSSLLDAALSQTGLQPIVPRGGALEGAHLLANETRLPYETKVFRAE